MTLDTSVPYIISRSRVSLEDLKPLGSSIVQDLLNVIYLSDPKVLANSGWPRKPGFKSEKKNVWRHSKILFQRKLHNY